MKLHPHASAVLIGSLLVVDAIFFATTDPTKVSSVWLMVGFLLAVVTIYVVIGLLLKFMRLYGISFGKHGRRIALFATVVVGGLLALQSMGELNTRDTFVIVPLAFVLYLYLSYGRPKAVGKSTL